MLGLIAETLRLSLSLAFMAGPCDLISKAAASALIGEPVIAADPSDPEEDEDTGGKVSHCAFRGKSMMLIVSQITFSDVAAARKAITNESIKARLEGEVTELVEESGLGDKSWWSYNSRSAQYLVLKGSSAVSVMMGGKPGEDPKMLRAKLRAAVASAAGALK